MQAGPIKLAVKNNIRNSNIVVSAKGPNTLLISLKSSNNAPRGNKGTLLIQNDIPQGG